MTDRCIWCGCDMIGWPYTHKQFLRKPIHPECLVKLEKAFKRDYGVTLQSLMEAKKNGIPK